MSQHIYELWLFQAKNDLLWAQNSLQGGFFAQVCFICQQVGEKSLKALAYFKSIDIGKTHSLFKLCEKLSINGEIKKASLRLDSYYLSARYPDALPDPIMPSDYYDQDAAKEAIELPK